jgi:hypothetical protein
MAPPMTKPPTGAPPINPGGYPGPAPQGGPITAPGGKGNPSPPINPNLPKPTSPSPPFNPGAPMSVGGLQLPPWYLQRYGVGF